MEKIRSVFKSIISKVMLFLEKNWFKVSILAVSIIAIGAFVYCFGWKYTNTENYWGGDNYNNSEYADSIISESCFVNSNGIATIDIRGEIVSYMLKSTDAYLEPEDKTSADDVLACVKELVDYHNVKGFIFRINSYGGSPEASEEITNVIKNLDKPTVAVVREGAVSAGYLIATGADIIIASEWSDIGGIGVTMSYLDYSQQNEADGIIYQQISSGKFKDAGDPDKPLTVEERELFMRDSRIMYEDFIKNVATNRNLDIEKVRELADGSSMLGVPAKENGLIDEIGDINSAENWLYNQIDFEAQL